MDVVLIAFGPTLSQYDSMDKVCDDFNRTRLSDFVSK